MTKMISVPYTLEGPYSVAKDRERADKLWSELGIDAGVVALSDSYVSEKGLPEAMRFPWDDTKGVYFVNAYHNLHCLVSTTYGPLGENFAKSLILRKKSTEP